MPPLVILATIRSGFEFGTQLLKFLQTTNGKRMVVKALDNADKSEENWRAFWQRVGEIANKLFPATLLAPVTLIEKSNKP